MLKCFDLVSHKGDDARSFVSVSQCVMFIIATNYPNILLEWPSGLHALSSGSSQKQLDLLSQAADSICDGDLVDNCIRSGQNWSLLPTFVSVGVGLEQLNASWL